jgi:hypothetical protein
MNLIVSIFEFQMIHPWTPRGHGAASAAAQAASGAGDSSGVPTNATVLEAVTAVVAPVSGLVSELAAI